MNAFTKPESTTTPNRQYQKKTKKKNSRSAFSPLFRFNDIYNLKFLYTLRTFSQYCLWRLRIPQQ